jgi:NAD(P)-dependent dehydrogenase (short-subunit alcohol dehydrogenase family)
MIQEMFDLHGRVAVVTGGAGNYGQPISEALAEAGAHVIIASRDRGRCQQCADQMTARGLKASAEDFDQGSETSILALRDRVLNAVRNVDVLVNNSVGRSMRSYGDPLESWRQSMDVNATGLFAVSRAFLGPMMDRGAGSIVNIASVQAVVALDFANYAGTQMTSPPDYHFNKHGLLGLTKYLAAVAGTHGVRVNAISPGGLQNTIHPPSFIQQYCRRVFLGRLARPDDIKGAVLYLAADASAYMTGQNLILDGGYTC